MAKDAARREPRKGFGVNLALQEKANCGNRDGRPTGRRKDDSALTGDWHGGARAVET
jgi:hypothetical protein